MKKTNAYFNAGSASLVLILMLLKGQMVQANDQDPILARDLECGRSILNGILELKSNGLTTLKLYAETTIEYEIALFGLSPEEVLKNSGLPLSLEVEVFRTEKKQYPRAKVLRTLQTISDSEASSRPVKQLTQVACKGISL